jgi:phospholipid transport system substrate-binding protein
MRAPLAEATSCAVRSCQTKLLPRFLLACVFVAACALSIATDAAQESASGVVERFQAVLISVMTDAKKLGYEGRYKRLAPAVEQSHELAAIAQVAVGRYWDQLDAKQRASLVDTFSQLSIATYAHRFDDYSGETFRIVSEELLSDGDAHVHSLLAEPKGEGVRFDYVLRKKEGRWRIVNIVADGVSDLAIKRAEYTSILRNEGFDALIEKLKAKIAQYSKLESSRG